MHFLPDCLIEDLPYLVGFDGRNPKKIFLFSQGRLDSKHPLSDFSVCFRSYLKKTATIFFWTSDCRLDVTDWYSHFDLTVITAKSVKCRQEPEEKSNVKVKIQNVFQLVLCGACVIFNVMWWLWWWVVSLFVCDLQENLVVFKKSLISRKKAAI